MVLVSGYVEREEVLRLPSVFDLIIGDGEFELEHHEFHGLAASRVA
jgi:hypothetical protein